MPDPAAGPAAGPPDGPGDAPVPGGKGLRPGAIGLAQSVVIGVSSTAPAYSMAATLGGVVALVGFSAPVVFVLAFLPMLFIAYAYRELNRVAPDCGTTFTWATKTFGPWVGWMGGWGIIAADVIVMASLAQIAGKYGFLMFGAEDLAASVGWTTVVGCLWIAVLTWVCYRGIELSARFQLVMLTVEVVALVAFAGVALVRVYAGTAGEDSVRPDWSWFNPFGVGAFDGSGSTLTAFSAALLLAVFIYWGWDSAVSVNEETTDPTRTPGRAAVMSTVILLVTYAVVAVATMSFAGLDALAGSEDVFASVGTDVLGPWFDKVLVFSVLTSAAASTQTTILPTARTTLSMAAYQALPPSFSRIHPRFFTPTVSTWAMGIASVVFFAALAGISENILFDSASAVGLLIAFYYGLTGFSAAWYFRRDPGRGLREPLVRVVLPLLGGLILMGAFVKTLLDDLDVANSYTVVAVGGWEVGGVFLLAAGSMLLGVVLMLVSASRSPRFFAGQVLTRDTPVLVVELPGGQVRAAGTDLSEAPPVLPDAPSLEQLVSPPLSEEQLRRAVEDARRDDDDPPR